MLTNSKLRPHEHPLKMYFIPYPWPSHLTSLFDMARLFASAGQHPTIISTPANVKFLQVFLNNDPHPGDHRITFHVIPFPATESGLPPGIECFSDISDGETCRKLHHALSVLLPPKMQAFIEQNPPDCIISDMFHPWSSELATRLGIPRFIYHSTNVFSNCVNAALRLPDAPFRSVESDFSPFVLSGLPHPISLTRSQVEDRFIKPSPVAEMFEQFRDSELESYGVVVNSFSEFDGEFTEHYKKVMGHARIWHLGPLSQIYNKAEQKEHQCINWLKGKPPNSVVYICFGSSTKLPDDQLYEIACGIQASGCNFIWVVHRKDDMQEDGERKCWLPEGFEGEIEKEDKGMIIREWAPQVMILESIATGAFVTHCGWNSIMEGVIAGVPLIAWPMFAEQFCNEKLVTQVHKIGVEVGALERMEGESKRKSLVKRECIERAVRKVIHGGAEAAEMRGRVRELGEVAKRAVEEGGSSVKNLSAMIQELNDFRSQKM